MNSSIQQCRYLLLVADAVMNGIDDSHVAVEPHPGLKTPGWLIGHLAITADFGRRLCGRKPAVCPREWRALFSPGTQPSHDPSVYPPIVASARGIQGRLHRSVRVGRGSGCVAPRGGEPVRAGAQPVLHGRRVRGVHVERTSRLPYWAALSVARRRRPRACRATRFARSLNSDRTSLLGAITCWVQWCRPAVAWLFSPPRFSLWVPE